MNEGMGTRGSEGSSPQEWDWERLELEPGQVLVVVSGHGHPDQVAETLERFGGRLVPKPSHIT